MTDEELAKKAEETVKRYVCGDCNKCQSHGYIGCDVYKYSKDSFIAGAKAMQEENDLLKRKVKNVREKLFNLLSEYEIGNYDNNTHQFYKDVYYIHNELMEGVECKNIIDV